MRTDGNLKIVVTISASINAHPTESSRKGHSLKSILWYLKLIQKLSRKKTINNKPCIFSRFKVISMYFCPADVR